jgi:anti-anti-sigma factor
LDESERPATLDVEHAIGADVHRIVLKGELDIASVPTFARALDQLPSDGAQAFVLDLSRLTFIDSSGVTSVLQARALCAERALEFCLIPGSEQVQRVFQITGLLAVLPFEPEPDGKRTSQSKSALPTVEST